MTSRWIVAAAIVLMSVSLEAADLRQLEMENSFGSLARANSRSAVHIICDQCPTRIVPASMSKGTANLVPDLAIRVSAPQPNSSILPKTASAFSTKREEVANVATKENGAAMPSPRTESCGKHIVYFRFGRCDLSTFEKDQLDQILSCFKSSQLPVGIEGFTCKIGPQGVNDKLAKSRAESVALYLEKNGIRVIGKDGHGKGKYISVVNQLNRRVEIRETKPLFKGETK